MALRLVGLSERTAAEADGDHETEAEGGTAALKLRRWLEGVTARAEPGPPPGAAAAAAAAAVVPAASPGTNGTVCMADSSAPVGGLVMMVMCEREEGTEG